MYNTSSLSEKAKYITGTFLGNDLRLSKGNEGSDRTSTCVNWLLALLSKSVSTPLSPPPFLSVLSSRSKVLDRSTPAPQNLESSFWLPTFYSLTIPLLSVYHTDTSTSSIAKRLQTAKRLLTQALTVIILNPCQEQEINDLPVRSGFLKRNYYEHSKSGWRPLPSSRCIVLVTDSGGLLK